MLSLSFHLQVNRVSWVEQGASCLLLPMIAVGFTSLTTSSREFTSGWSWANISFSWFRWLLPCRERKTQCSLAVRTAGQDMDQSGNPDSMPCGELCFGLSYEKPLGRSSWEDLVKSKVEPEDFNMCLCYSVCVYVWVSITQVTHGESIKPFFVLLGSWLLGPAQKDS